MKIIPSPACLRVNLLKSPFGVRRDRLAFSWVMTTDPHTSNANQTAYRITVAQGRRNSDAGFYVYDSGWVLSDNSTSVRPEGLAACLKADTLYYWQVSIRDSEGNESPLSPPQAFTVGEEMASAPGVWAMEGDFAFLRQEFTLTEAYDRVLITAAAVNPEPARQYAYTLYVNGSEVGVGAFRLGKAPDGQALIYYQTYDVTSLLRQGENCIGANCYALSDKGFFCRVTAYGGDGQPHTLVTTEGIADGWQALCGDAIYGKSNSIGTHYFTAHACNLDAPIFPFGFAEPGFDTSRDHGGYSWTQPAHTGALMGGLPLRSEDTEPVSRYATHAGTAQQLPDGTQLIDLGAEIIGGLRWTVQVPHACTVTLTYGEQLADGRVKCPMNTGNRYVETWTLQEGGQTLETTGMMAFRWVQIENCPVTVTPDTVWGLELRKPFDESASALTSDNSLLLGLHKLTKHTVKVTSQDIYVDSQSRERGAYEGDFLINMLAAYAAEDSFAPARLTTEYLLGHRTWPADYLLMIIFAARADYMATGDDSLLREWYDTLKSNLFTEYLDETGLIRSPVIGQSTTNAVLVDWPATERDGYEMSVPYNTVFNALNARAYADMAAIAAVLGKNADALEFNRRAEALREVMIQRLYDPTDGLFFDGLREDGVPSDHASQHATAFALDCGIYTDQAMADCMAEALAADGEIRMSVYGAFFLLEGLYRAGHGAIANRLLLNTDASEGTRSWAYMMYGLGATVTSEAWNQKNKPNMTLSHPWGAAPAHMIASGILGVTPTSPAYETFDARSAPMALGQPLVPFPPSVASSAFPSATPMKDSISPLPSPPIRWLRSTCPMGGWRPQVQGHSTSPHNVSPRKAIRLSVGNFKIFQNLCNQISPPHTIWTKGVRNMTATNQNRLAEEYARDYMGKIFYYCLRKTGDSHEAEDLASDITLQILTALHEGVEVLNFPAWVWQIARNRYALWAKTNRRRGETESFIDPDDPETENILTAGGYNTDPSVAEEYAHNEEMAILRRELAFLGRDYREIVVAYYIEDRSVGDIAKALGQPEGTVKSRLFRSRNLLKEGMKMAREFGPKSYKPEEVRFVSSGGQASGLPFSAVQRMLPKNILLEASNNPSTAEELSVAVGVAMPYMEEEIAALVNAHLLKQVGNRYVTNFFIESRDLQVAIRNELILLTRDWAERYNTVMEKAIPIYREGCFVPKGMTDGEMKWHLALELLDQCVRGCKGYTHEFPVKHKHPDDSWGFIGYEGEGIEEEWFVGQTGSMMETGTQFWSYQIGKWDMWNRAATWNSPAIKLIGELISEGRSVNTLTSTEKEIFDQRNPYTFSVDEDGQVIPNILTLRKDEQTAIRAKIAALPEYADLQEAAQTVFDRMVALLRREGHAVLEDQLPYCASSTMWKIRPILLDAMVDKGILTIPTEPAISTVAMELIVK